MSTYLNRVNAWRQLGYRFAYLQSAQLVGHLGMGFLEPFKYYLAKKNQNGIGTHKLLKEDNNFYKGLYRYTKTLDRLNQDFLMRPIANVVGFLGGLLGLSSGLFLSVIPAMPPKKDSVTRRNQFFSDIQISVETKRFFGVLVWSGIVGLVVGSFYSSPIIILGHVFKGALGFSELFSTTGVILYQVPSMLRDTWHYAKKIGTALKNGIEFIVDQLTWVISKGIKFLAEIKTWMGEQLKFVLEKISSVFKVIKEQGLKGLLAWAKDKTFGTVLRYLDNLSGVREVNREIRSLVSSILDNKEKSESLFKLIAKNPEDTGVVNKVDLANIVMQHIELIAEGHRTNYQKGNVQVKLAYLENLKINLEKLNKPEGRTSSLVSDLQELLNPEYRSWKREAEAEPVTLSSKNRSFLSHHELGSARQLRSSNDEGVQRDADKKASQVVGLRK
jgi:hypothetical protein